MSMNIALYSHLVKHLIKEIIDNILILCCYIYPVYNSTIKPLLLFIICYILLIVKYKTL